MSVRSEMKKEEVELMQPKMRKQSVVMKLAAEVVVGVVPLQLPHLNQAVHSADSAVTHQSVGGSAFVIDVLEWEPQSGWWWWLMMTMMRRKWSLMSRYYYLMAADSDDGHW